MRTPAAVPPSPPLPAFFPGPGRLRSAPPEAPLPRIAPANRGLLAGLALALLLSSLGTSSANVALPALAAAFDASFSAVQWVVLGYLLAVTTLIVISGRLGDLVDRRRLLLAGILVFVVASGLGSVAPSLGVLIAARAMQGIGAAMMMALTMTLVGDFVPPARLGGAMGLMGSMSALGTALGPALGGLVVSVGGWRAIFLLNIPLGLGAWLLVFRHLPTMRSSERGPRGPLDLWGAVLLTATLGLFALAVTLGRGRLEPPNLLLLIAAAVLTGLFLRAQSRSESPLVDLRTFRDATLSASLAANALVATIMMATLVVGPFHLSRALGLDAPAVGLAMSTGPAVAALIGFPAGRLVDLLGPGCVSLAGLTGIAVGSTALVLSPASLGVSGYVVPIAVITACYSLFQAANHTVVMQRAGPGRRGVVAGLLHLSRNLGLVTGASVMAAIFALATGTNDLISASPAAVAEGTRTTFLIAAILAGGAAWGLGSLQARAGRRDVERTAEPGHAAMSPLAAPPGRVGGSN